MLGKGFYGLKIRLDLRPRGQERPKSHTGAMHSSVSFAGELTSVLTPWVSIRSETSLRATVGMHTATTVVTRLKYHFLSCFRCARARGLGGGCYNWRSGHLTPSPKSIRPPHRPQKIPSQRRLTKLARAMARFETKANFSRNLSPSVTVSSPSFAPFFSGAQTGPLS